MSVPEHERLRRWRLVLGNVDPEERERPILEDNDLAMDQALAQIYDSERRAGLGASAPRLARWLGDIRQYFPTSVVKLIQRDAIERYNLRQLLLEKELLADLEPDVHLIATLITLGRAMPQQTRETARQVVTEMVRRLQDRLEEPMRAAVRGALDRSVRNRRPRAAEIDWPRTIAANLRNYQPELRTVVPERLVGFGRRNRRSQRHVILCIDQSGSMATSVVYASIFGAVMASLPAVSTSLVVFDTAVVDLTDSLSDPVDVLFGVQLGGGTDINRAIGYCQSLVREPAKTVLVLISDLIEGGVAGELLQRTAQLIASGVTFISLLALSDDGRPSYDALLAQAMSDLGAPAFACTPDLFPDMMAAALRQQDLAQWASVHDLITSRKRQGN